MTGERRIRRRSGFPLIGLLTAWTLIADPAQGAAATPVFARYPTSSATQVAFVARGALWVADMDGRKAVRLIEGPGEIVAPHFSPDGRHIAFTRDVDDSRDIYVMDSRGGEAKRLTFDGAGDGGYYLVLGWTPDGSHILVLSSHNSSNSGRFRAFSIPWRGGLLTDLGLDRAGLMSISADGRSIIYNRIFRNLELRKRYVGGAHQNLYAYDFSAKRLIQLTDWKGTDTSPMLFGHTVYFLSDRGPHFRLNIWALDLTTKVVRQITHFTDYDVDWPSIGAGGLTFQQGGRLYRLDPASERLSEIKPIVPDDGALTTPREVAAGASVRVKDALGGVDYSLSPDGASLLVSAHGDLVRLAADRPPLDLTRTPGVDEDHPTWSPDGGWIAYTTDEDGEQQVAVRPARGGVGRRLTKSPAGYFYSAVWSPKGDALAVADAHHGLWLIPLGGGAARLVAQDPYAEIRDASFSPDGRWLAYSTQRPTRVRAIHLHDLASGQDTIVSSPMESDRLPVFTADGHYLAFVSQRHEQTFVSDRDDESLISTINSDGVYIAPLSRHDAAPGAPGSAPQAAHDGEVRIDLQGLMARATALPVMPTVIASLEARGGVLFYETQPPQLIGGDLQGGVSAFHALDLATLKDRVVVEGISSHALSADGAHLAFEHDGEWRIASTGAVGGSARLDTSDIRVPVDPPRDWTEMLANAWRLDRDVFFNPRMNGSDWPAVRAAYARLWPLIGSEQDFNYLLAQMQGEIASSHTFIIPAPAGRPAASVTPRLGADFALDIASGRYRFARIYAGDPSRPTLSGPLGAPGLDIGDGDYLLAVNGRELRAPDAPLSAFVGISGPLALSVSKTPDGLRHTIIVQGIADDSAIRRLAWVADNRALVDRLSGGKLGYVALSDFDDEGSKEFVRQFYPQLDRQGLIFDVRWNRGGFTSQSVLEVLRRLREGVFVNREGALAPLPTAAPPPAMVAVENYASSSDGDQFPFYFRAYGLGPVVGERTWGGVQGINGPWRLMDGTGLFIPKDSLADREGHWIIENEGVAPDLVVDTSPADPPGTDTQLMTAVQAGLRQLKRLPAVPARAPAWLPAYPGLGNVQGAYEAPSQ